MWRIILTRFFEPAKLQRFSVCGVYIDGAPAILGPLSGFQNKFRELFTQQKDTHCFIKRYMHMLAKRTKKVWKPSGVGRLYVFYYDTGNTTAGVTGWTFNKCLSSFWRWLHPSTYVVSPLDVSTVYVKMLDESMACSPSVRRKCKWCAQDCFLLHACCVFFAKGNKIIQRCEIWIKKRNFKPNRTYEI